jgi:hypothetical protein
MLTTLGAGVNGGWASAISSSSARNSRVTSVTPPHNFHKTDVIAPAGACASTDESGNVSNANVTRREGLGGMLFRATASGRTVWRLRNLRAIEMRKTTKILNLATALSALVVPAVAPEIANATKSDEADIAEASEPKAEKNTEIKLPRREDLMGFTVHQNSDGNLVRCRRPLIA